MSKSSDILYTLTPHKLLIPEGLAKFAFAAFGSDPAQGLPKVRTLAIGELVFKVAVVLPDKLIPLKTAKGLIINL